MSAGTSTVEERVVAAQVEIALTAVREQSSAAADLVSLCCFLAADDIPRRLLLRGAPAIPAEQAGALTDANALNQASALIATNGLWHIDGDGYRLHRRVQETLRNQLDPAERASLTLSAARLVLLAFPERPESSREWATASRLVPHALSTVEHVKDLGADPLLRARLLERVARYLIPQGQLDRAAEHLVDALGGVLDVQPEGALHGTILNDVAIVARERGHLHAARRDAWSALMLHRGVHERPAASAETGSRVSRPQEDARRGSEDRLPTHSDIADDLMNLGIIARQQEEFAEARAHLRQAHAMRLELGDAPGIAEALVELFHVEFQSGDARAIERLDAAIAIEEEVFGATDIETATSRDMRAILQQPEHAAAAARRVLARHQEEFSPRHPQTADALRLLASMLQQVTQLEEARELARQALNIDLENYGEHHFRIGTGFADLMAVEALAGNKDAAMGCLRKVVAVIHAAPPTERVSMLRLTGLFRHLSDLAAVDGASELVDTAQSLFDEAIPTDEEFSRAVREMTMSTAHIAGDRSLRGGLMDEARTQYERGMELALLTTDTPLDDADFHIRLAVVGVMDGRKDAATEHFAAAVECLSAGGLATPIWTLLRVGGSLHRMLGRPDVLADALHQLVDQATSEGAIPMFEPEISSPLPENWIAKESTTLLAPDGQANVIASSEPLSSEIGLVEYAEVQGSILAGGEFPGYKQASFERTNLFGDREGFMRQFEWTPPDGVPVTQIQLYYVENSRGYTATATTPSEVFPEQEMVLKEILRGLRLAR